MIILKISLWRCQAGALTSSCALIMILFINHEWIFGGSWDAEIRLQTTRQGMRDPHYQWIGSIRNRQGTSDDTDTQEGHKTSSIIWFLKFVLLLRRLMQALRHLIQIPRIMNSIITWSAWSEWGLMMILPFQTRTIFTFSMFRILMAVMQHLTFETLYFRQKCQKENRCPINVSCSITVQFQD